MNEIEAIIAIPKNEETEFKNFIKKERKKLIRTPKDFVKETFSKDESIIKKIKEKKITEVIEYVRQESYNLFLLEEAKFNTAIIKTLHQNLKTPKDILNKLIEKNITSINKEEMIEQIKEISGEYAGRIAPYFYCLSLSNTNSRRARSGSTFENIIYQIYEILNYPFDSQKKVGKKLFEQHGLGKKVDSILPGLTEYENRRNKTIIGTMKTSLRERWQEVAEEIVRTNMPEIHLLTVDNKITTTKAKEMNNHNIVIVAPNYIAESDKLRDMKNIISFEEYFFVEIPNILKYWEKNYEKN